MKRQVAGAVVMALIAAAVGCAGSKPQVSKSVVSSTDGSVLYGTFATQAEAHLHPSAPISSLTAVGDAIYIYTDKNMVYALSQGMDIRFLQQVVPPTEALRPPVQVGEEVIFPSTSTLIVTSKAGDARRKIDLQHPITSDVHVDQRGLLLVGTASLTGGRVSILDPSRTVRPAREEVLIGNVLSTPSHFRASSTPPPSAEKSSQSPPRTRPPGPSKGMGFETSRPIKAGLVIDDYALFVASGDSTLYALDRTNGHIRWRYMAQVPLDQMPLVTKDHVFQVVPDMGLVALNKTDGKLYRDPLWVAAGVTQVVSATTSTSTPSAAARRSSRSALRRAGTFQRHRPIRFRHRRRGRHDLRGDQGRRGRETETRHVQRRKCRSQQIAIGRATTRRSDDGAGIRLLSLRRSVASRVVAILQPMPRYFPDFETFVERARDHDIVPVYRQLLADRLTPVTAFEVLGRDEHAFLLESVVGGERVGRHSFIAAKPRAVYQAKGANALLWKAGEHTRNFTTADPLADLQQLIGKHRVARDDRLPLFTGGLVGYAGYDLIRYYEPDKLNNPPHDDRGLPDVSFGLYDELVIFDHVDKTLRVVANGRTGDGAARANAAVHGVNGDADDADSGGDGVEPAAHAASGGVDAANAAGRAANAAGRAANAAARAANAAARAANSGGDGVKRDAGLSPDALRAIYSDACRRIDLIVQRLQQPSSLQIGEIDLTEPATTTASSNVTREQFEAGIRQGLEYIRAGDIFQFVPSLRLRVQSDASPLDVYRALRVVIRRRSCFI